MSKVKDALKDLNLTQERLAIALGVTQGAVNQFLNGDNPAALGLVNRLKIQKLLSLPDHACITEQEADLLSHPKSRSNWRYLYIMELTCNEHSFALYGATEDLARRLKQHRAQYKAFNPTLRYHYEFKQKMHAASIESKITFHFTRVTEHFASQVPPGMSDEVLAVDIECIVDCIESHIHDCDYEAFAYPDEAEPDLLALPLSMH